MSTHASFSGGPYPDPPTHVRGSVLDGLLRSDAGELTYLELGVLELVGPLLGQLGAEPAQEERERDGDQARVVQREPVEVDVLEQRRADAGRRVHRGAGDHGR